MGVSKTPRTPPPSDRRKFRSFFSLSRHNFHSFFSLLGVSLNFGGVLEAPGPCVCTRSPGGPLLCCARSFETTGVSLDSRTKRAHFRVPAFKKTPPKFNENERETKSEILGPPFGAPTLRGRTDGETTAIILAKIGLAKFWPKIGFGQDWPSPKHDGQNGLAKNGPQPFNHDQFYSRFLR